MSGGSAHFAPCWVRQSTEHEFYKIFKGLTLNNSDTGKWCKYGRGDPGMTIDIAIRAVATTGAICLKYFREIYKIRFIAHRFWNGGAAFGGVFAENRIRI